MCVFGARFLLGAGSLIFFTFALAASAETNDVITFTNRSGTITNLQGRVYEHVKLERADLDGLVYFSDGGGGRISYTNLAPADLEALGVDTNRIAVAAERAAMSAEQKKADYARRRQRAAANIQQFEQQTQQTNGAAGTPGAGSAAPTTKHTHKKNQNQPTTQPPSN